MRVVPNFRRVQVAAVCGKMDWQFNRIKRRRRAQGGVWDGCAGTGERLIQVNVCRRLSRRLTIDQQSNAQSSDWLMHRSAVVIGNLVPESPKHSDQGLYRTR